MSGNYVSPFCVNLGQLTPRIINVTRCPPPRFVIFTLPQFPELTDKRSPLPTPLPEVFWHVLIVSLDTFIFLAPLSMEHAKNLQPEFDWIFSTLEPEQDPNVAQPQEILTGSMASVA